MTVNLLNLSKILLFIYFIFSSALTIAQPMKMNSLVSKSVRGALQSQVGYRSNSVPSEINDIRPWELRTSPIALFARWYTLDVSYRISKKFSTGPTTVIYDAPGDRGGMLAPTYKGYAVGWHANYFFNSVVKNTWYLSVRSYYESYKSYPHSFLGYEDRKGFRSDVLYGFQWKWSSVNLMSGLGLEYTSHDVIEQRDSINSVSQAALESHKFFWRPMIEFKLGIEIL